MMDQDSQKFERLHQLVTSQLEDDLSDDKRRELVELLRDDAAAQQFYVESIEDVTSLRWWCAGVDSDAQLTALVGLAHATHPAAGRRIWSDWGALAGLILVAVTAGLVYRATRQPMQIAGEPQPDKRAAENAERRGAVAGMDGKVATLTRLRGVRWQKDTTVLSEMSRLPVGQVLRLEEGEVEILFDKAVQLIVRSPASIEIRSSMEVFSTYGVMSARVGESGKGFVIQTPQGRITDLGTEFGIAIAREGATEVAVFRGAVDLAYGMQNLNVNARLVQGQAVHVDSNGTLRRLVAIKDGQFPTRRGRQRRQPGGSSIFLDVRDNIREPLGAKFYRIVPRGLGEDVLAYVDRQHEWNGIDSAGIPEFLLGADYIMPFNADKWAATLEVTVTIGRPAVLFVFLTDNAFVPDWLKADFVDTGLKIGLDEHAEFSNPEFVVGSGPGMEIDTQFSIWKREIPEPMSIMLGSIRDKSPTSWGYCMYGIAAIPLDAPQQP